MSDMQETTRTNEETNQDALEQLLYNIENATITERDKGSRFETLVLDWLKREPTYNNRFTKVQTYASWAAEHSELVLNKKDTGIDLVGTNAEDENTFTAIQCKFYRKDARVPKVGIDSFIAASNRSCFTARMIIATNENWSENLQNELRQLNPAPAIITRQTLAHSMVDWSAYLKGETKEIERRRLRPYQKEAVKRVCEGFKENDRGKLIMACGTGKTFTALCITEKYLRNRGLVLFLVPSLSLLSQVLTDWKQQAKTPITAFAVCSDSKTGKARNDDIEDLMQPDELVYPATTTPDVLAAQVKNFEKKAPGLIVVFSTYHSLEVISKAQNEFGLANFDLIICDEAHRTAGGIFVGDDESIFTRVHDNTFVHGTKRLYMTATPKIYGGDARDQADRGDVVLYSMEDESIYGPVLYSFSFNEAVRIGALVDYKVIVLAVDESVVGNHLIDPIAEGGLPVSHAAKVIGCWRALTKVDQRDDPSMTGDLGPMQRVVGYAQVINPSEKLDRVSSKAFTKHFQATVNEYRERLKKAKASDPKFNVDLFDKDYGLDCDCKHIDGSMNAVEKSALISWLKEPS